MRKSMLESNCLYFLHCGKIEDAVTLVTTETQALRFLKNKVLL